MKNFSVHDMTNTLLIWIALALTLSALPALPVLFRPSERMPEKTSSVAVSTSGEVFTVHNGKLTVWKTENINGKPSLKLVDEKPLP